MPKEASGERPVRRKVGSGDALAWGSSEGGSWNELIEELKVVGKCGRERGDVGGCAALTANDRQLCAREGRGA